MSEEKKSFFVSLEPTSALIVGVVSAVLVLGTIGFVILAIVMVRGGERSVASEPADLSGGLTAAAVVKSDRPAVELFAMSYCPYGLQMEKALLPVWNLLADKADFHIRFVSYAMHGLKEIEENSRQYCIAETQPEKFMSYLNCFTGQDDYQSCLTQAGVNVSQVNSCVASLNAQYQIMEKYNDQSTWLSGSFPLYPPQENLNEKYNVAGSPTLIINGAESDAARSPEAVKQAVCAAFSSAPAECQQALSTAQASSGFGSGTGAGTAAADCGV